jgi:beta-lactamase class A
MSRTDFVAPSRYLPRGMKVAHKIGTANKEGFNDCGIVYAPKSPFVFCAMLTQADADKASEDISKVVKLAYDHLNR